MMKTAKEKLARIREILGFSAEHPAQATESASTDAGNDSKTEGGESTEQHPTLLDRIHRIEEIIADQVKSIAGHKEAAMELIELVEKLLHFAADKPAEKVKLPFSTSRETRAARLDAFASAIRKLKTTNNNTYGI